MAIQALQIINFRNLLAVECHPVPAGLNIISGENGSGKTSLLEAIYYLSHGRSFRSGNANKLINHEQTKFSLYASLQSQHHVQVPVGVERARNGESTLRVASKEVNSVREAAEYLPIRMINAHSYSLLEAGPQYRRQYLDWGLFYHYPHFFNAWRHFERALKQRNILLKARASAAELAAWTQELIKYGNELNLLRQDYVAEISPIIEGCVQQLLGMEPLHLSYYPGWDESVDYEQALAESYADEMRLGYTQCGPHRADLDIAINMIPAKYYLSRGQQKLLICAMILAQGILFTQRNNHNIVYLIDDLPAELDANSRAKLINLLVHQNAQVFITAIESQLVSEGLLSHPHVARKLFHVEHGYLHEQRLTALIA